MKHLLYLLLIIFLTGCIQEVVQAPAEYRGDLVLGDVITTDPVELSAEPLDFNRAIPTDSTGLIRVVKSDRYQGFDPADLDTVQVVLRYSHGTTFWLDSATLID